MKEKLQIAIGAALVGLGLLPFSEHLVTLIVGSWSQRSLLIVLTIAACSVAGFGLGVMIEGARNIFSRKDQ